MKNRMTVSVSGVVVGTVECRHMMQSDVDTCQPIVTQAGARKLAHWAKLYERLVNADGDYTPRIVGWLVRPRGEL